MGGVELGDPKNEGGWRSIRGFFLEGGVLSCYIKCEQILKIRGG